ncbi:RNA polymerase sigma (SigY) subunit [Sphingobacterium allocomposti]|uniref:RNA polymerase sigma (SigY) subunit n=1 Tax=Sphingobacterium allocomposti TaxID=415956 RepID=A0A5S5DJ77_9SPHI|nr:RNA polymerase sigma factor [Sphingobacterium composti Yoo et al. 2007 non Ten et al. 2007]TYP95735.1 RNA polymerase sigma (SigY) subunit [Sphingobacterium composti Yoo et al. 2007 non Ten et al. 2007]
MESRELNFELLKNQKILKNIAYKFTKDPEEIEELVQEALVRSVKYVDKFFNNPKLVAWLYVIMKNVYINNYRRNQKHYQFEDHQKASYRIEGCTEPSVDNHAEGKFVMNDIQCALKKLPKDYYDLFIKFMDGYKYRELSEEFNMPEGTIKTRIHYTRKFLQKQLSAYGKDKKRWAA